MDTTLQSPRLIALQTELAAGQAGALTAFWQEVAAQGTPLLEPVADQDHQHWVTFLVRAAESKGERLLGGPAGGDLERGEMTRLAGTELWYKTFRLRSDARFVYWLVHDMDRAACEETRSKGEMLALKLDPLNPRPFPDADDPYAASVAELPAAAPQPWVAPRPDVPRGQVAEQQFASTILGNERTLWVYTPPGYQAAGDPCDLLLVFDGPSYTKEVPTPVILDNLLHEGRIAPTVAVMIGNATGASRITELPCNPDFARFLAEELLPWLRQGYAVTTDPARTTLAGSSFGGLAAVHTGLRYPQLFGNVLSQSGSFWWHPDFLNLASEEEPCSLVRQFRDAERLPLRFYLDVGLMENRSFRPLSQLQSNRHMRDVLLSKGYEVHYAEYNGGHDYLSWAGTLAEGLLALVGR